MQQIVGVIGSLVSHRETNMQELYEQGTIFYPRKEINILMYYLVF